MAKLVRKLTAESLKKMIQEEAKNLKTETSDPIASGAKQPEKIAAEEVEAEDLAGSLEKDILEKFKEPCPEALVESAIRNINILENENFFNLKVSVKSSDVSSQLLHIVIYPKKLIIHFI